LAFIESGAAADEHLADQLMPFLAVVGGVVKTNRITDHVRSNIYVAEKFLDVKFTAADGVISCEKNS
jgi:RNA 3'-terminal phosphate cyclase (ATP)